MNETTEPEVTLTIGEKIAGQIVNVLDTQHPEINWPFETIAALIDQGLTEVARDQRQACAEALRDVADSNSSEARMDAAAEIVMNASIEKDTNA